MSTLNMALLSIILTKAHLVLEEAKVSVGHILSMELLTSSSIFFSSLFPPARSSSRTPRSNTRILTWLFVYIGEVLSRAL